MDSQVFFGETMEKGTGSKSLAIAAIVSLIIHGGIFLAYALVFKGAGMLKNYEPLKVALILPGELEKPSPRPLTLVKKEKARLREDQGNARVPADLVKEKEEAPPQAGPLAAKAEAEAAATATPQIKNQEARNVATVSLMEHNARISPETTAPSPSAGVVAYLPATGSSPGKTTGSGINLPGSSNVTASVGETSSSGYTRLTTFQGAASTSAAPRYNENALPVYPLPARRRGYAGVVTLSVEVLADGRVGRLATKKTSGYDLLDKSAQETVKGWKFSPGKKMGTPVSMWVDVPVRFELN